MVVSSALGRDTMYENEREEGLKTEEEEEEEEVVGVEDGVDDVAAMMVLRALRVFVSI